MYPFIMKAYGEMRVYFHSFLTRHSIVSFMFRPFCLRREVAVPVPTESQFGYVPDPVRTFWWREKLFGCLWEENHVSWIL